MRSTIDGDPDPAPQPKTGGAYVKLERKVGDFATAGAAVQVTLGKGGEVASADRSTNAGRPRSGAAAEKFLGRTDAATIAETARRSRTAPNLGGPPRSVEYKEMACVLTARALKIAVARLSPRCPPTKSA